jgi:hypothetical protein
MIEHDAWRSKQGPRAGEALAYWLLEKPQSSSELSAKLGVSPRQIEHRLVKLECGGLVAREGKSWKRTERDLDSVARDLGTMGRREGLREQHLEERTILKLRQAMQRSPRGNLRVVPDDPAVIPRAVQRFEREAALSRSPDAELARVVALVQRTFPGARLVEVRMQ